MNKTSILLLIATTLMASGCASTSSQANKGAAVGAVVGALLGKATGDNDKSRYVWGAALGAIAGSAVGQYMDEQEKAFKEELADSGVEIHREGDNLRLSMPGGITFDTASANISTDFYPILDDVALILNKYPKTTLVVEGHTDDIGTAEYNQLLSEKRALSVSGYLQRADIEALRLQTIGYGELSPAVKNSSVHNRQVNRRVELRIIPVTS